MALFFGLVKDRSNKRFSHIAVNQKDMNNSLVKNLIEQLCQLGFSLAQAYSLCIPKTSGSILTSSQFYSVNYEIGLNK